MLGVFQSFGLLVAGYFCIFTGLAFSNKQLFPSVFNGIYDSTNFITRIVIFSVLWGLAGNYFIAKSFQVTSASIAGPLLIIVITLISITNSVILDKIHITLPIIGGAAGAVFFCCLTAWLLEAQRATL